MSSAGAEPDTRSGTSAAFESLARRLLTLLGRLTGLESTYLTSIDWERDTQRILYSRNVGDLKIPEGLTVVWSDTLWRRALDGGPAFTADVPSTYPGSDAASALGLRSYLTVAIEAEDGSTWGTLCGASSRPVEISEDARQAMGIFAEMVAAMLAHETDRRQLRDLNVRLQGANEALRELAESVAANQELLRLTQDGAATGIGLLGLDGRWLQVNPALCSIVGRSAEELLSLTFVDVAHPDDVDFAPLHRLLRGDISGFEIEGRCVRPDGTLVWTQIHLSLLCVAGHPDRLIIQVLDVDERRRHQEVMAREVRDRQHAEEKARRERDFLGVVLASIQEGYVYTVDGEIIDVNEPLCRLTGFSRDELVGRCRPYPFWPPDETARLKEAAASLLAMGGGDRELTFVRRDGTPFPAAIAARPALAPDGARDGFITIITDLTAVKRRESQLLDIASRDALTGMYNRRAIDQQFALLEPDDAVVILDLDHFKAVNDTHGHAAGDRLLTSLAGCITATLRDDDWAGRLGGEEFILVARRGGLAVAATLVERLRRSWDDAHPLATFSAGVAAHLAGTEPRQTLARADEAMYRAKRAGRNRTEIFIPAPTPTLGSPPH